MRGNRELCAGCRCSQESCRGKECRSHQGTEEAAVTPWGDVERVLENAGSSKRKSRTVPCSGLALRLTVAGDGLNCSVFSCGLVKPRESQSVMLIWVPNLLRQEQGRADVTNIQWLVVLMESGC